MEAKTDPRIDAYIASAAEFARPIMRHLRKLVHAACPEAEETIKWSAPTYLLGGRILCAMAAFKAHCAFRFWHGDLGDIIARDGQRKTVSSMGHFGRIERLSDLPSDERMTRYIREAAKLNRSEKPARPRPAVAASKPELPVPEDLAALFKKNKNAAATFENFSPSCRREYLVWIAEAKRTETRRKRLETTLEWLKEGRKLNWKYANC
jgi:uncharacterized protein YdeI (YjbR/CyaY-like superfamily)